MKKFKFVPKEYLNGEIKKSCKHLIVSKDELNEGLYGNYYDCLFCGKHLSFPRYYKNLDTSNRYVVTTIGELTPNRVPIYQEFIKLICKKYINEDSIDIVSIIKSLESSIKQVEDQFNEYSRNNKESPIENSLRNWLTAIGNNRIEYIMLNKKEKTNKFKETNTLIDLHTHTCYSDGDLTPNELLKLAISKGIGTISITDHDTLLGNKNINHEEIDFLNIIPGIELTAKTDKGRMHILGYDINIQDSNLNKKMEELRNNSIYSVLALINQIKKDYGIILPTEDIINLISTKKNIGRPDLAKLIVKYGLASTPQNAFDRYLIEAYNKTRIGTKGLTYEECIDLILKAGGIPVIAHPKTLELNHKDLLILIKKMISVGLMGIEVFHSDHTQKETEQYIKIAEQLNLLYSGGSDYHGEVKPNIELGSGKNNNLQIKKLTLLDRINNK